MKNDGVAAGWYVSFERLDLCGCRAADKVAPQHKHLTGFKSAKSCLQQRPHASPFSERPFRGVLPLVVGLACRS